MAITKHETLKENYTHALVGIFHEIKKTSVWNQGQGLRKTESVIDKIESFAQISREVSKLDQRIAHEIGNMSLKGKDFVAYSFMNGKVDLAGAVKLPTGQMLWPLITVDQQSHEIKESQTAVKELLRDRSHNTLDRDMKAMQEMNKALSSAMKNLKSQKEKSDVTLDNHSQRIASGIKFGGTGRDIKF